MMKSGAAAASAAASSKNEVSTSSLRSTAGSSRGARVQRSTSMTKEQGSSVGGTRISMPTTQESWLGKQTPTSEYVQRGSSIDSQLSQSGTSKVSQFGRQFPMPEQVAKSSNIMSGSKARKRSRLGNDEMLSDNKEDKYKRFTMDELLQQLDVQIEAVYKKGDRGRTTYNKMMTLEIINKILLENAKRDSHCLNMAAQLSEYQEEKEALQQQIIELQTANIKMNVEQKSTPFLDAVNRAKATSIETGRSLPVTRIPEPVRQAPPERILIYKAEVKGEMATKVKQEEFRMDLKETLGEEVMQEVTAVRPTRYRGHLIIFCTESGRNKAMAIIRQNEEERGVEEKNSCIITSTKKFAKVVCRDPPDFYSPEMLLAEMCEKQNPYLQSIPLNCREARIFITRLGWIFEISAFEAAAVQTQNNRISFGYGREMRVEEFIPLQQCYKCCEFGHSAINCRSEKEYCRLCGSMNHSGKDCEQKDDKTKWRYVNYKNHNEVKGMNLDVNHGAAQLHKCPITLHQKEIKKSQLAQAGVFTSIIEVGQTRSKIEKTVVTKVNNEVMRGSSVRKKTRYKSLRRQNVASRQMNQLVAGSSGQFLSSSSSSNMTVERRMIIDKGNQRRLIPTEQWQTVSARGRGNGSSTELRGRPREFQKEIVNSEVSCMVFPLERDEQMRTTRSSNQSM